MTARIPFSYFFYSAPYLPSSVTSFKSITLTSTLLHKTPKFLSAALISLLSFRTIRPKSYIGNIPGWP